MIELEYYNKKIMNILNENEQSGIHGIAINKKTAEFNSCENTPCEECLFYNRDKKLKNCTAAFFKWGLNEHKYFITKLEYELLKKAKESGFLYFLKSVQNRICFFGEETGKFENITNYDKSLIIENDDFNLFKASNCMRHNIDEILNNCTICEEYSLPLFEEE